MGLEMGLWRIDGNPVKLQTSTVPLESQLETLIEQDTSLLGTDLLLIGRQIPTAFGKYIDLLGIDVDGAIHILELKRDRTPREVVAQLLDYASWAQTLSNADIRALWQEANPALVFDVKFAERFGVAPPDEMNVTHVLTIVASGLDSSTERIVTYLNTTYGVPINAIFFRYFVDDGRQYLARTWLIDETRQGSAEVKTKPRGGAASEWNGLDWYVSFGDEHGGRNWNDAQKFGFVSAGGGEWYSRTLRNLPVGARIFVFTPGSPRGYVGVGTVSATAVAANDATLTIQGSPMKFTDLDLTGKYNRAPNDKTGEDAREYVVAVDWTHTVDRIDGVWKIGMFANQNSACRLKSQFTIDAVMKAFDLADD